MSLPPPQFEALWAKVRKSSFYAAMNTMPPKARDGMFAIYAFCRAVDDIADDEQGDRAERTGALDAWRSDIAGLYAGGAPGQASFLVEAVRDFALEQADFIAVIDGMQMDVDRDIVAPDAAVLDLYCDRVASAVGRLSVKTFGMEREPGVALSHHLGRALQLTNILRDLDEDAGIGRFYLPREALEAAGVPVSADPAAMIADPRIDAAARAVAGQAREHYRQAAGIMRGARGNLTPPRLMGGAYSRILGHMDRQGWAPPRRRVSLSKAEKLWVLLRHGLIR